MKFMPIVIRRSVLITALLFLPMGSLFAGDPRRDISRPIPPDIAPFSKIRILVAQNKPEVKVSCPAPIEVFDDRGGKVFQGAELKGATVKPAANGIQWWTKTVPTGSLLLKSAGGSIRVGGKGHYGDTVLLYKNSKGGLDVINEVPLEDYLKSVIPFEANPLWPSEALKAQVVASRSYALLRMIDMVHAPYDVSSGVFSQVYVGKQIENPKTNQAVDDTRGEVLTYKDKVFPGYFHSTCGGHTASADLVWKVKPVDPLRGVECQYCKKSPHYRWEASFTPQEIKEKMAKKGGIPVQEVNDVSMDKADESGRTHTIRIRSAWIEKPVDADAFRGWMGPEKYKSNLITRISKRDGKFVFKGRGWGHGVGLCQYGMKYLGELGYGYHEILGYYYPGAQVTRLNAGPAQEEIH
jgi:stage II sporulation protein D